MAPEEIAVMVVVLTIILGVPLGLVTAAIRFARQRAR